MSFSSTLPLPRPSPGAEPPRGLSFAAGNALFWGAVGLLVLPSSATHFGGGAHAVLMAAVTGCGGATAAWALRGLYRKHGDEAAPVGRTLLRMLPAVLLAGTLLELTHVVVDIAVRGPEPYTPRAIRYCVQVVWPYMNFLLLAWSGLYLSHCRAAAIGRSAVARREAESRATAAELARLRHQLNPHLLFNALNTLRSMIAPEDRAARTQVDALADYLRLAMAHPAIGRPWTAREEIESLRALITVERARFAEEVTFQLEVPEELGDFALPDFLLQPLVENAIKHGRRTASPPVVVEVHGWRDGDTLVFAVRNTGRWAEPSGAGVGLVNVRARLRLFAGEAGQLTTDEREGRVEVAVRVPARRVNGAARVDGEGRGEVAAGNRTSALGTTRSTLR